MEQLRLASGLAFIFDMDGVLIESTALHTVAWETYLETQGVSSVGVMDRMFGKRNDQIVAEIFGSGLGAAEIAAHGADKERVYRELMSPAFDEHIVAGVVPFVRAAHDAGIPCGLATNAEPANVEFVLSRAGLTRCFKAVVDGHQVEHPKPHPEIVLKAAAELGTPAVDCIVFEDSPGGMKAARAAGARLVGLLTTLEDAPLADLAIPNFTDSRLIPWLSTLSPRSVSPR
jgi:HAD superfamily hydrolase (TIGR01509 family)